MPRRRLRGEPRIEILHIKVTPTTKREWREFVEEMKARLRERLKREVYVEDVLLYLMRLARGEETSFAVQR